MLALRSLKVEKTHAAWTITHCLRHSSETYERNIRVLEAVEKPLEVKKKNATMLRDFIFGLKNNTARGLEHYSLQTLNHTLQIYFFFFFLW